MFAFKKKYFFIINDTSDINLNNFNRNNKFTIIYRNNDQIKSLEKLLNFRQKCKSLGFKFFVANNIKLSQSLKSDGIYISASNSSFRPLLLKKLNKQIIGSAHNIKEINKKINQGCKQIIISKLFKVAYDPKSSNLGVVKFNFYSNLFKNIIPLGGIAYKNLNKLRSVRSNAIAIMTEIKKKPAISNRLF